MLGSLISSKVSKCFEQILQQNDDDVGLFL